MTASPACLTPHAARIATLSRGSFERSAAAEARSVETLCLSVRAMCLAGAPAAVVADVVEAAIARSIECARWLAVEDLAVPDAAPVDASWSVSAHGRRLAFDAATMAADVVALIVDGRASAPPRRDPSTADGWVEVPGLALAAWHKLHGRLLQLRALVAREVEGATASARAAK